MGGGCASEMSSSAGGGDTSCQSGRTRWGGGTADSVTFFVESMASRYPLQRQIHRTFFSGMKRYSKGVRGISSGMGTISSDAKCQHDANVSMGARQGTAGAFLINIAPNRRHSAPFSSVATIISLLFMHNPGLFLCSSSRSRCGLGTSKGIPI